MNKILKRLIELGGILDPHIRLFTESLTNLTHRDDDPTNDVEETATELTAVVINGIALAHGLNAPEFVNLPALEQLAANIKGDIGLYIKLVKQLKPAPQV